MGPPHGGDGQEAGELGQRDLAAGGGRDDDGLLVLGVGHAVLVQGGSQGLGAGGVGEVGAVVEERGLDAGEELGECGHEVTSVKWSGD